MKRPSIRTRLLIWTTLATTIIMIGAGYFLFQSLRNSLYSQFDNVLNEAATVIMIEVEVQNSRIYHEWKESLERSPLKAGEALIQVWDYHTDETARSRLLGEHNLERNYGALGERVFYNLTLPDGRKGRAVGILTLPVIEEQKGNEGFIPAEHPQIFVWAQDTDNLIKILQRARTTFLIAGSCCLLLIWSAIFIIISLSSRAMSILVDEVRERDGSEVGKPLSLPDNLPSEIAGIAERFNALLHKIDTSRERDRDFFMNVAHEVRTPLAGVRAIIEQALRKPREVSDYQVRLQNALREVEGLNRLVNRLMKFGRLKQKSDDLELAPLDLNTLTHQLWSLAEPRASVRNLTASWNLDPDGALVSDAELVKVVVTNLVENAVSYATTGSQIEFRSERRSEHLHLFVSNQTNISGDPLPHQAEGTPDVSRFFDPFYRADKSRDLRGNHAGIGLSFSKEIMEILKGSITATSTSSGLVVFEVTFPLDLRLFESRVMLP